MATEKLAAIDFETAYSSGYSVTDLGNYGYTHDPRFDAYLVSVVTDDGFELRGHPKDCPWEMLRGYTWLSHNMGFDWAVFRRLVELGIAPADVEPKEWHCTANLCVYVGLSRALGLAVKAAFGVEVDKGIRNNEMKGMRWDTAPDDLKRRVLAYALDDSRWCLKLWREYSHEWPEHERWLSRHTYEIGAHGVCVDVPALDRDIAFLKTVVEENYNRIPWTAGMRVETGTDAEGEPVYEELPPMTPLSKKALKMKCDEVGIPMPSSLAQDSEECAAWEDQYGDRYDWIARMRTWRRTNALLKKFEAMRVRVMPNGRMEFALLYFGASTGRWSGAGGINMQNLARQAFVFDADFHMVDRDPKNALPTDTLVDMRSKIIAPPGHALIASDLSQVEPRCARPGSLVKTPSGYKFIDDLKQIDKVWDGFEYVSHEGTLCKKTEGPFVRVAGTWLTSDHVVYCRRGGTRAGAIHSDETAQFFDYRRSGWFDVWQLACGLVFRIAKICCALPMLVWRRARRESFRSAVRAQPAVF